MSVNENMKKALSVLLCLLMLVGMLPQTALAAEECLHSGITQWNVKDTQHSAYCSECQQFVNVNHYGGTATCTTWAICEGCGGEYGGVDPNKHSMSQWSDHSNEQHLRSCTQCGQATEYEAHSFDDDTDTDCNGNCGYTRTIMQTHEHTLAYTYSDTEHWQECTAENCPDREGSKTDLAAHNFDSDCDTDCNDSCGYTRQTSHSPLAGWIAGENGHWHDCEFCGADLNLAGHNYKTEWSYDAGWHWHECAECGYGDAVVGHIYDSDTDTTCVCGYIRTVDGGVSQAPEANNGLTYSSTGTAIADPTNPKTGDAEILWSAMAMLSLLGMAVLVLKRREFSR